MVNILLTQQDEFLHGNKVGSLRRAECSEVTYLTYLYEAGIGWDGSPDIEGVYRRCV